MKRLLLSLLMAYTALFAVQSQTITIYDAYNSGSIDKKNIKTINNNLQWSFSLLTKGTFAFAYERRINDYISVEIGAGPTLFLPFYLDPEMKEPFSEEIKNKMGYFISGAAKVYPLQMIDFEGFYFAPTIRHFLHRYDEEVFNYDNDETELSAQKTKVTDFAFMVGYQYEAWSGVLWNFYSGFAWSKREFDKIEYDSSADEFNLEHINKSKPSFILGISVGFSF